MTAYHVSRLTQYASSPVSILPLVVFRLIFGLLMGVSLVRFVGNGWVDEFYLQPDFHFTYYGFSWVKPLPGLWLYAVFGLLILLTVCITLGLLYRLSMVAFCLLFTYIELLDKSYYLNHYYFISLLSFLLIFLPLHRGFSVDAWLRPTLRTAVVPRWTVLAIRLQLASVYLFAGIAKLKADWLFEAMPLKIWLSANSGMPLIGFLFDTWWFPYLMSWSGAIYDLTIPFLLFHRRSRPLAYLAVLGFHLMTAKLFYIGMFPWMMIACTLIFFDERDYRWLGLNTLDSISPTRPSRRRADRFLLLGLMLFFLIQIALPFRHWLYPGNVLWTEEGFRFSWNVMLVEKTGYAIFHVRNPNSQQTWTVYPNDYLTAQQEKQMSFQPDMLLQFAHHLANQFERAGHGPVEVRAEVYVSLNGRPSRLLIDPTVDLSQQPRGWQPKSWILPLE